MLLVIVKANLYGDNSFTTNGNFLVSNYGVKYNLLLTVNNIEILFKFKCGVFCLSVRRLWQTPSQINNTPHLPVCICKYMTEQAMSAIAILDSLKFPDFLTRIKAKTLSSSVCSLRRDATNIENTSLIAALRVGYCSNLLHGRRHGGSSSAARRRHVRQAATCAR